MIGATYSPTPSDLFAKQLEAFQVSPRMRATIRAWRYYDGTAYQPAYGRQFPHPYTEWDETQNGPRPAIQPLARRIVDQAAQFLFGEPPTFTVGPNKPARAGEAPADNPLHDFLQDVLRMNGMAEKWLPEARKAGVEGGTVFKFAWTPQNRRRPVAIHTLSPWEVTWYRDDLDADVVQAARIRIKYRDGNGQWWLYQETWSATRLTVYQKLRTQENSDSLALTQFVRGEWPVEQTLPNPFGLIPLVEIVNRRNSGDTEGVGDYWDENLYRLMDQYNHTCWLEHYSNQLDGNPTKVIINAPSFGGVWEPGTILKLQGEGADAKILTSGNELRQWMKQYKDDIRRDLFRATSTSDAGAEEITNKGNLTRAVWNLIFGDSLAKMKEQRIYWGECGLSQFFENMLLGLSRLPDAVALYRALREVRENDPKTYSVTTQFGDIFKPTAEERQETIADAAASVSNGFLPRERAVRLVARAWGITDEEALLEELEAAHERLDQEDQANADLLLKRLETIGQGAGGNGNGNGQGGNGANA